MVNIIIDFKYNFDKKILLYLKRRIGNLLKIKKQDKYSDYLLVDADFR